MPEVSDRLSALDCYHLILLHSPSEGRHVYLDIFLLTVLLSDEVTEVACGYSAHQYSLLCDKHLQSPSNV